MIIKEVLPGVYQKLTQDNTIWGEELLNVNLHEIYELTGIAMEEYSKKGPDNFNLIARTIIEDILNAKKMANEEEVGKLDFLQFIHCTEAARFFSSRGVFTECHDWLVFTLSDELNYKEDTVFHTERIDAFLRSHDPFINLNAIPSILDWINVLFYYSRHHGGLVEFATNIFKQVAIVVLHFLKGNLPLGVNELDLVHATSQILSWAVNYQKDGANDYAISLANYFEKTQNNDVKKIVAFQLAVGGAEYTSRTSSEWSQIVLNKYAGLLVGHERMQISAKYYSENIDQLVQNFESFKNTIQEYIKSLNNSNEIYLKYEKARLFGVINELILVCLEKGMLQLASDIITEFYEIDKSEKINGEQLFIVCNYINGVLYSTPFDVLPIKSETANQFVEVVKQTNQYLGSTIALNNYAEFKLENPERQGVPVIEQGIPFEKILNQHYQFAKLTNLRFDSVLSMIIIPGFQHPIQSLMVKSLGFSLPVSCSFERPSPKRQIKKVLLWCFGTRTSDLEISLTTKMFESVGIEVEAANILEIKREEFVSKYKSPDYDLIWVGTHGNYDHFKPHQSRIDLHPEGEVELSEIFGLIPDTGKQRMLFLNICDGATASTLNALYDIGLGASLCNRNQAVLSHIWMVQIESSFIYGVLYAHYLLIGNDFYIAYENVIKAFLKGKDFIRQLLSSSIQLEEELKYYIEKLDDKVEENIYYWGSGVYYQ